MIVYSRSEQQASKEPQVYKMLKEDFALPSSWS